MANMQLPPDFKEFLSLLNSEAVEYLLVGGYAVGLYGYVRPTMDMDIWVSIATDNLTGLVRALERFGFAPNVIQPQHFQGEKSVFRMGVPPNRLEIITQIDGVTFNECINRKRTMNLDGIEVPVISLEDLCKNKLATPRLKDKADVEQLRLLSDND
jgi:hypothetical protein